MTHPSSRTATALFKGRRLYLPRRSSRIPTNSWRPFDRAVPSHWHSMAEAKGYRIVGRVRDRLHLVLECRKCGSLTAQKAFTLCTAQPRCGGCAEAAHVARAARAGITFLRPSRRHRHYALYRLSECGHVVSRQRELIERVAGGRTAIRCDRCLRHREAEVATKQGWTRLRRDPEGNPNYRLYRHACGHEQRIAVANMQWGQVQCSACGTGWNAKASFIYLFRIAVPEAGLHVLKLGFSKHPVKRLRHQLGLPRTAQVDILRVLPMPTGHDACAAETRAHAALCRTMPETVVPQAEYAGLLNVTTEIYRPEALAAILALMDAIEADET